MLFQLGLLAFYTRHGASSEFFRIELSELDQVVHLDHLLVNWSDRWSRMRAVSFFYIEGQNAAHERG